MTAPLFCIRTIGMWTREKQLAAQRHSMERSRFGRTKEEVFSVKGKKCAKCGTTKDLVIDHISGGGRHLSERGMVGENTHSMGNFQVLCRSCQGEKDAARGHAGLGNRGLKNG